MSLSLDKDNSICLTDTCYICINKGFYNFNYNYISNLSYPNLLRAAYISILDKKEQAILSVTLMSAT